MLVATQGQGDEDALERALSSPATHVLMIASRRKAERLRDVMRMRGIDESQLARLAAPAGPDAGAKTPGEIALVAIVGVLAFLRGRGQRSRGPAGSAGGRRLRPIWRRSSRACAPRPMRATPAAKFVNPVCGMAVDTAAPKHIEKYEGVAYYFCCDGCLTTFRRNPRSMRRFIARRREGPGMK